MVEVIFHDIWEIEDNLLKYAVIAAEYNGKWIFCRHKKRNTWEIPGGHREMGETIEETAKRELYEETGAVKAEIAAVNVYGVVRDGEETSYGMLFYADVKQLGDIPTEMEIGEIMFENSVPEKLTYPEIQPVLFGCVQEWLK
ncbi:MAG: NUDIX domain-containing protein [Lachnospiraceae bacterium]|nr:NUDIX domain-containing protein [Lachnospiraceae bacterium]